MIIYFGIPASQVRLNGSGNLESLRFEPLDVADEASVRACARRLADEHVVVDVLVNNAGIALPGNVEDTTMDAWRTTQAVNGEGVFMGTRAAVAVMKARGGSIINISSVSGIIGNPGQGNYAASKAGMIGMTKSLAREAASRGITANCIAPGFIQTAMTDVLNEKQQSEIMAAIPAQKFGTPEDIAAAQRLRYLAFIDGTGAAPRPEPGAAERLEFFKPGPRPLCKAVEPRLRDLPPRHHGVRGANRDPRRSGRFGAQALGRPPLTEREPGLCTQGPGSSSDRTSGTKRTGKSVVVRTPSSLRSRTRRS